MALIEHFKPVFWKKKPDSSAEGESLFNYRRIWKLSVFLTGIVALLPLIFITAVDYKVTENSIESEMLLRTSRIVSNTRRAISFFLTERRSALNFIVRDNTPSELNDPGRLTGVLENLQESFGGGFVDLGIIDRSGVQSAYAGPYGLEGRDYSDQPWFSQVVEKGIYISDVFLGFRRIPHLVIAVKKALADGSFYVLRASLDIEPFEDLLSNLELGGRGDAFIINHQGILQTHSRYYGRVLEPLALPVPDYSNTTEVLEGRNPDGAPLFIGYRFIEDTPFILMIVKNQKDLMKSWYATRLELILFLGGSVTIILAVILGTATYMVRKIYTADQRRLVTLHRMEYANKMASIGRMAASVAHEINNPLAIINEKAGLISDLFTFKKDYTEDPRLQALVASILASVKRAGRITKRLLTFARNLEATVEAVDLRGIIDDVLSFLQKEAEHRGIGIEAQYADDLPVIESDRGKLQQIFLNIVNNAFAAVKDGGRIRIRGNAAENGGVVLQFEDDGCGIPAEDLHRIFEPFYSTKIGSGGTGLGLSITYNLVREIGGSISVESEVDRGTCFTIRLPRKTEPSKEA